MNNDTPMNTNTYHQSVQNPQNLGTRLLCRGQFEMRGERFGIILDEEIIKAEGQ
jgi:hypothetical protein